MRDRLRIQRLAEIDARDLGADDAGHGIYLDPPVRGIDRHRPVSVRRHGEPHQQLSDFSVHRPENPANSCRTFRGRWQGAGVDAVAELRGKGVGRGDLVALVLAPGTGLALATVDRMTCVAATDDPVAVVRGVEEALRPRWVMWSNATAVALVEAGVRVATSWDIAAVHRLLFGGWRADPARVWAQLHDLALDALPGAGSARPVQPGRRRRRFARRSRPARRLPPARLARRRLVGVGRAAGGVGRARGAGRGAAAGAARDRTRARPRSR